MNNKRYFKAYRRKEKTDYGKRLSLLKSGETRLVVRITGRNVLAQLIQYAPRGDNIILSASSKELQKLGWKGSRKNEPAAYLVGYLLAKKSSAEVKQAVLDIGKRRSVAHSRIYAAVKGAIDGGLHLNAKVEILPDEKRVRGEHISEYARQLSTDRQVYEKMFSLYLKNGIKPEDIPRHFEEIKEKILDH